MRASPSWSASRVSKWSFPLPPFLLNSLPASKHAAADRKADGKASTTDGAVGRKKKVNLVATPLEEPDKSQPATLEEWEAAQEREDADALETRKCPEYTMTYRQAVGTEDVFLQVRQLPPSLPSCSPT